MSKKDGKVLLYSIVFGVLVSLIIGIVHQFFELELLEMWFIIVVTPLLPFFDLIPADNGFFALLGPVLPSITSAVVQMIVFVPLSFTMGSIFVFFNRNRNN